MSYTFVPSAPPSPGWEAQKETNQAPPIPLCLVPLPPQDGKHKRRQTQAPPIPLCLVPLPRMVSTK